MSWQTLSRMESWDEDWEKILCCSFEYCCLLSSNDNSPTKDTVVECPSSDALPKSYFIDDLCFFMSGD